MPPRAREERRHRAARILSMSPTPRKIFRGGVCLVGVTALHGSPGKPKALVGLSTIKSRGCRAWRARSPSSLWGQTRGDRNELPTLLIFADAEQRVLDSRWVYKGGWRPSFLRVQGCYLDSSSIPTQRLTAVSVDKANE